MTTTHIWESFPVSQANRLATLFRQLGFKAAYRPLKLYPDLANLRVDWSSFNGPLNEKVERQKQVREAARLARLGDENPKGWGYAEPVGD